MFLNRKNNVDRFRSLELKIILSTKKKEIHPKKEKKGPNTMATDIREYMWPIINNMTQRQG